MKQSIGFVFILAVALFILAIPAKSLACDISVDGWMTDTEDRPISNNTFNIVVNKRGIITSTNPGGFFYHIQASPLDVALNSITISALIPPEFNTHGGKPVKVYLNGTQVYNGSDLSHTLFDIPSGSVIQMKIHLKYAEIKNPISPPYPKTYYFDAAFVLDPAYGVSGSAQATLTAELH